MLIQFSARNFKSFKDSFTLDLFTNKDESVCPIYEQGNNKVYPSAVFYGANGSGKSNILKAFTMMRRLVLNEDKIIQSTDVLPMNRFKLSSETEDDTTAFDITFFSNDKKYKYGFEYDEKCVYSEYLYVYETNRPTIVFEYDVDENNGEIKITKYEDLKTVRHLKNSLFIVEADRNDNEEAKTVLNWFKSAHYVEYASRHSLAPDYWDNLNKPAVKKIFQKFISDADIGIKDIFQDSHRVKNPDMMLGVPKGAILEEVSVKTLHSKFNSENEYLEDEKFNLFEDESLGTQKYFYVIGPVIDTLQKGTVLFLDELDASLHPILTQKILSLFNNRDSNPNGAQLIFTSQDTNLLNQNLFDKEQIWFVEKDKYGSSHIASLSEYKNVRKEHKIERNYIMGKYGAIPYLGDFNFEEL
ncbi:MAG: ATP-binding protein [Treponema sp.]|nr:ATP-binding protein [Treponema sp.]